MAHCAKYTKGAMGHLMKHYERGKDENGDYIKFGNESIDTSLSHLNYNLAPHQNQLDFIHKRLSEVHCLKRKDVNVMCSWVVTAPKELPEKHTKEFFQRTYDFLEKRYGKENVVSAYVHLDETTPHIHFSFVPVVFDSKKGYKVSAKEVLTKSELKSFHKEFQREMDGFVEQYENEFECNVLNGATVNGNKTIQELKVKEYETIANSEREQLNKLMSLTSDELINLERLKEEVAELEKMKDNAKERRNKLWCESKSLEKRILELREDKTKEEKEVERRIKILNERLEGLFKTISEYKAEISTLEEKKENLGQITTNLQTHKNTLEKIIEEMSREDFEAIEMAIKKNKALKFIELTDQTERFEEYCRNPKKFGSQLTKNISVKRDGLTR